MDNVMFSVTKVHDDVVAFDTISRDPHAVAETITHGVV